MITRGDGLARRDRWTAADPRTITVSGTRGVIPPHTPSDGCRPFGASRAVSGYALAPELVEATTSVTTLVWRAWSAGSMTDNDTEDDELWRWMTRGELRALNDADRQRALAAMTCQMKGTVNADEPYTGSARGMTAEQLAQMKRAQQLRAERMSRTRASGTVNDASRGSMLGILAAGTDPYSPVRTGSKRWGRFWVDPV